ncbi:MAG: TauD/TfdA family dioxygenase [Cellvibrio sp.]|uniref:TauD/TfdA family dioxygenase n=1 Tax=Cellvibrio sp. TaxID=1965322 RepID=UPI002717111A|nr:TauD/TfdA family dioxygenase [Cellvibrio sp.]
MDNPLTNAKIENYYPNSSFILKVTPETEEQDIVSWIYKNAKEIDNFLASSPALLMRGFKVASNGSFSRLCNAFSEPLPYVYQSTPRTKIEQGIYTATEYPKTESIPQHCENSYQKVWPMRLYFHCEKAAEEGGETPLGDVKKITSEIPEEIISKFREKKVMYVRNYSPGLDLPWQTVFQTENKSDVENFCRKNSIEFEWVDGCSLRTRQVCQGTAIHPNTGDELWFNQAHLFHVSNLEPSIKEMLLGILPEQDLPRNAFYGDGTPIEDDVLAEIRRVFNSNKHNIEWQDNDILMIDNMLCSHGRNPYIGERKVLVSMNTPSSPK